ncbi:hypothetical protein [Armillaria spp. ambi-like virus 2]|nr:hypothetical protein [Armillaria spp. ambi-like virus 2]
MSFYIAQQSADGVPQAYSFLQRNISGLTQTQVSKAGFYAQADVSQLAYDGYRANISAFLFATHMSAKVDTHKRAYPLSILRTPELPLPLPPIYFQFKTAPSEATLKIMHQRFESFEFEEHTRGRTHIYTMKNPPPAVVYEKLIPTCLPHCQSIQGYGSLPSYRAGFKVIQIISLYLATNTYPFSRTIDGDGVEVDEGIRDYRISTSGKRKVFLAHSGVSKRARVEEEDVAMGEEEQSEPEEDDEDDMWFDLPLYSETMVAKPSPIPASANFGSTSDVPFLPGMCFPYFPGMNREDPQYLRDVVYRHFFRNLAELAETEAYPGWKRFSRDCTSFAFTEEGKCATHMMKGVEMSLESQTVLYCVFDGPKYIGFVLLGGRWKLYDGTTWHVPVEAEKLREILHTWTSHEMSLEEIASELSELDGVRGRPSTVTKDLIKSSAMLAKVLGKTSFEGEKGVAGGKKIAQMIERLSFPTRFQFASIKSVPWLIEECTTRLAEPIPDDLPIYIPLGDFELFARKEYQVLCSFGSRCPQFYAATGTKFRIPGPKEEDTMFAKNDKGEMKLKVLVVGSVPPKVALRGWDSVKKEKSIRFDPSERSKEKRCYTFKGEEMVQIWNKLKETVGPIDVKGKGKEKAVGGSVASGSRAFGTVDVDSIEW